MLRQSVLDKIPKVDYYITGGTNMGRILACKKPFYRGNGVYHLSMDLADWEVQGEKTLTQEQLLEVIEQIRDLKVATLKEAIRLCPHLGFKLEENTKWVFKVVKDL